MRLYSIGTFALEPEFDYLAVWGVQNSGWNNSKVYTGTTGPTRAEEFVGRSFFLRFETDYSVTAQGFKIAVEFQ